MADYLETDNSDKLLHKAFKEDMTKFLKRMSLEKIKERAEKDLGILIPDGTNKTESIILYLKEFVRQAEEGKFDG